MSEDKKTWVVFREYGDSFHTFSSEEKARQFAHEICDDEDVFIAKVATILRVSYPKVVVEEQME